MHESLNLAKVQNAPMLFVIENNLFASHMHISLRQPSDMISRFAVANEIPHRVLDGNDVVSISEVSKNFVNEMRSGEGPRLIEVVTYRWFGHVDWRDDVDVGVERSLEDIQNWKARDPIARLSRAMVDAQIWSVADQVILEEEIDEAIQLSWERALNDPYPSSDSTLKYVYSDSDLKD